MSPHDLESDRFTSIEWVAETGSTNADLVARARRHPTVAAVRFADLQTAGRGRRDRRWDMAPGGGLLVSFYVPWLDQVTLHAVPTALGVAAVDVMRRYATVALPMLKWPNDVICSLDGADRKLAGMLSEVVIFDGNLAGVVVGFGCNVSWPSPDDIADHEALSRAVALDAIAAQPVSRGRFAADLLSALEDELTRLESLGVPAVQDRYRDRCVTLGQQVAVQLGDGTLVGRATDVDNDGVLLLEVDGRLMRVDVGDVVHLRTSPDGH